MTVHLTPGHAKGCTAWTMKAKENGERYNAIFVGSTTVPRGYNVVGNEKYPGIAADLCAHVSPLEEITGRRFSRFARQLFTIAGKIELLAAHPDRNPFIDPNAYQDFIDRAEKTFQARLKEQQKKHESIKIKK